MNASRRTLLFALFAGCFAYYAGPGGNLLGLPASAASGKKPSSEPDDFDAHKPSRFFEGKTFHIPAGASFSWQAWEKKPSHPSVVVVNGLLEQALVKVERVELSRLSDAPESLQLNQYILTVNPDVVADSILVIKVGSDSKAPEDRAWNFQFVLHIVPADRYIPFTNDPGGA